MGLIALFVGQQIRACRFVEYYAVFVIPYMLSNVALLIALFLSLRTKPREINDGNTMFFVCLFAANMPILMQLSGVTIAGPDINATIRQIGSAMSVAAIPFYLAAVINLGKNLSVLPEASSLQTNGIYRYSRHPLYVTYIYWYLLQIAMLQSWTIVGLSVIQVALQVIRAKSEERILEKNFPEYTKYKREVWWIGKNLFWARRANSIVQRSRPEIGVL
jgi:protein-S-isoprenylcysteine O-methyltransferase Ste14